MLNEWERYDARLADLLAERPKCDRCGEHIQDDFCFVIDSEILCEECMIEKYRKAVDFV